MPRSLDNHVAVVTGASSGIGRAVALALAAEGVHVALAARRAQALEEVARDCRRLGVGAIAVPTDVTRPEEVSALAGAAVERFGRVDVWISNAAVSLFARLDEAPLDAWRRVLDTNLLGTVHGAREAIRLFRGQGRGTLIDVASLVAHVGQPYTSAYVASKFAIRGLDECLRQELADAPEIHVCTILPPSVDTPLFQQAGNYTGRAVTPMTPIHDPDEVAAAIIGAIRRPRREIFIDLTGHVLPLAKALAPGAIERASAGRVEREHLRDAPAAPSSGNLFAPMPGLALTRGGWRRERRSSRGLVAAGVALALLPLAAAALRRRPR